MCRPRCIDHMPHGLEFALVNDDTAEGTAEVFEEAGEGVVEILYHCARPEEDLKDGAPALFYRFIVDVHVQAVPPRSAMRRASLSLAGALSDAMKTSPPLWMAPARNCHSDAFASTPSCSPTAGSLRRRAISCLIYFGGRSRL